MKRHPRNLIPKRYQHLLKPLTSSWPGKLPTWSLAGAGFVLTVLVAVLLGSLIGNGSARTNGTEHLTAAHQPSSRVNNPKSGQSKSGGSVGAPAAQPPISSDTVPSWYGLPFYLDPNNGAAVYSRTNPGAPGSALIGREGQVPTAEWFGDWNGNVQADTNSYVTAAANASALPVLVLYNIPGRDCGSYSAGGAGNSAAYLSWVQQAAAGIGNRPALVILEPDALAGLDCLPAAGQQDRFNLLSQAVSLLKAHAGTAVYVDAGNAAWQPVNVMAYRLTAAGVAGADGFSLNVSNFVATAQSQSYGDQLSQAVGGKHYVIDTSRNGNGGSGNGEWCNPAGRALGALPTTHTGDIKNDAWLWIKLPWESDGACNGAPAAGQPYWSYAIQLAQNAGWQ